MSIVEIIIIIIKIRKNLMPYDWNWDQWISLPGVSLAKNKIIPLKLLPLDSKNYKRIQFLTYDLVINNIIIKK